MPSVPPGWRLVSTTTDGDPVYMDQMGEIHSLAGAQAAHPGLGGAVPPMDSPLGDPSSSGVIGGPSVAQQPPPTFGRYEGGYRIRTSSGPGGGALPSSMGGLDITDKEDGSGIDWSSVFSQFRGLSRSQIASLQRRMFLAGYYGRERLAKGDMPELGSLSSEDYDAIKKLVYDTTIQGGDEGSASIDDVLNNRIKSTEGLRAQGTIEPDEFIPDVRLHDVNVETTDQSTIAERLQSFSKDRLGRRLSQDEISGIVGIVSGEERANAMTKASQQIASERAQAETQIGNARQSIAVKRGNAARQRASMGQMNDPSLNPEPDQRMVIHGGDPTESASGTSAQLYMQGLSNQWGLQMTGTIAEGDTAGREFTLSGDPAQMQAFWDMARENSPEFGGAGTGIESAYIGDDGQLHVTMQEGASVNVQDMNLYGGLQNDIDGFLSAVRRPGGQAAFGWEPGGNDLTRHGAFQMTDRTYAQFAQAVGLDANDKSAGAQAQVAREYVSYLYDRYKDWNLVAAAYLGAPVVADNMSAGLSDETQQQLQPAIDDVIKKMNNPSTDPMDGTQPDLDINELYARQTGMYQPGRVYGGNISGGSINLSENYDTAARSSELFEQQHATEIQGFGAVSAYEKFSSMLRGGSSGSLTK